MSRGLIYKTVRRILTKSVRVPESQKIFSKWQLL